MTLDTCLGGLPTLSGLTMGALIVIIGVLVGFWIHDRMTRA